MVTVLTRTIGPSGRDYASFTLAEADVTNIGTSADLVANDEAIVFEADAGTYNELVSFNSTLTSDATRNVTYRPASGDEHGGVRGAGVVLGGNSGSYQSLYDDFTAFDQLNLESSLRPQAAPVGVSVTNCIIGRNDIATSLYSISAAGGSTASPFVIKNSVFVASSGGQGLFIRNSATYPTSVYHAINCTFDSGTYAVRADTITTSMDIVLVNSIALTSRAIISSTATVTGSNNFGPATNPFPVAIQGSPYPITATTNTDPGTGDFAIYDAATGALVDDPDNDVLNQGAGPLINSNVPKTDIVGAARDNFYADPGAFQVSSVIPQLATTQAFGAAVSHQRTVTRQSATVSVAATAQVRS
jgi:hypothetical protein